MPREEKMPVIPEVCGDLLSNRESIARRVTDVCMAASPSVTPRGKRYTREAMEVHMANSIEVFLRLAGDLRTELTTDVEWELQQRAWDWSATALRDEFLDLHTLLRYSRSAHSEVVRILLDALPDDRLLQCMRPIGEWHASFFGKAHRNAVRLMESSPAVYALQRREDHARNWALDAVALEETPSWNVLSHLPQRVFVLMLRSDETAVRKLMDIRQRPEWWWTVWRPDRAHLSVVGDLDAAPATWLDDSLDVLCSGATIGAAVVAVEATRDEVPRSLAHVRRWIATQPVRPVRAASVLTGPKIDVLSAVAGDTATSARLSRLLADLDTGNGLRESLDEFLKNDLNLARTAERLGVHRSTLTYRLDRIARSSGVDPRSVSGAAVWWLVLTLGDTYPDSV
ncbi:helix-turn-helix domain-containing protein [Lentzea sp. HUAS12]|uniref:helix-turn-helix domain-containing protein n=1 Tax=Lentzea sp. HUAS12 TaxID=2951806 RepID=UPI00209F66DC|nr:PucR family transcriptional regulator [Lentzea sp. HUAS12]USX54025.1 helix-turn-helix domain-containing protein [Lentzea sp. HUAS12]